MSGGGPWYADPHYGQMGDPPHPLNERKQMTPIDREEAMAHAKGRSHDGVLHVMNAFAGADWPLEDVLELIRAGADVGWIDHMFGHDLLVIHKKRSHYLDVPWPEKLARTR